MLDDAKRYKGDYRPGWVAASGQPEPCDNVLLDAGRRMWEGNLLEKHLDTLLGRANVVMVISDSITVDNTAPVITDITFSDSCLTSHSHFDAGLNVAFSITDAVSESLLVALIVSRLDENDSVVEQFIIPKMVTGGTTPTPVTFALGTEYQNIPLDGRYSVDVLTIDNAGNEAKFDGRIITVDRKAPSVVSQTAVRVSGGVATCTFRCDQTGDERLVRSDTLYVSVNGVCDSTLQTIPATIAAINMDGDGNLQCTARFTIPSGVSMFHFDVLATDKYQYPNATHFKGATYRLNGRMPEISAPVEDEVISGDVLIRGVATDPTNNGSVFRYYRLDAQKWDITTSTWIDVSKACAVPAAYSRIAEGPNVSFIAQEQRSAILGHLDSDSLFGADTGS
jgi:hypothetical protein